MGFAANSAPISLMNDSDNDGLIDMFEVHVFGSLAETPLTDFDWNGLSNQWEITAWTAFIGNSGWNLQGDEDLDGLNLLEELMLRTNFKAADTDGDGVNDEQDLNPLDPNLSSLLTAVSIPGAPIIQLTTPADATLAP